MASKEIEDAQSRYRNDPTDFFVPSDGSHIVKGGLKKGGAFLEFYHINSKQSAVFKAFLTSLNDNFNVGWKAENVYGRSDPMYLYESNGRVIDASFDIPAYDHLEAQNNLAKVSLLATMLYPTYGGGGKKILAQHLKSPPIIKVKFANIITGHVNTKIQGGAKDSGLACAVSNLTVTPDFDSGVFVDGTGESGLGLSKAVTLLPKLIKISISMQVIHAHTVGWRGKGEIGKTRSFPYGVEKEEKSSARGTVDRQIAQASDNLAVMETNLTSPVSDMEETNEYAGTLLQDSTLSLGAGALTLEEIGSGLSELENNTVNEEVLRAFREKMKPRKRRKKGRKKKPIPKGKRKSN